MPVANMVASMYRDVGEYGYETICCGSRCHFPGISLYSMYLSTVLSINRQTEEADRMSGQANYPASQLFTFLLQPTSCLHYISTCHILNVVASILLPRYLVT